MRLPSQSVPASFMRSYVLPALMLAFIMPALIHQRKRIIRTFLGDPPTNSCADLELSSFDKGKSCGFPPAYPCFDHSRCLPPPQGSGPRLYVYDQDCSLANSSELAEARDFPGKVSDGTRQYHHEIAWYWRQAAMEAGVLAEAYESACLFVHVRMHQAEQPCAAHSSLWNGGANHIMVDFTDGGR